MEIKEIEEKYKKVGREFTDKEKGFWNNIISLSEKVKEDEERTKVAKKILRDGWIEATPENIKCYLDGFIMANKKSFEDTGISGKEYIDILTNPEKSKKYISVAELAKVDKNANFKTAEIEEASKMLKKKIREGERYD